MTPSYGLNVSFPFIFHIRHPYSYVLAAAEREAMASANQTSPANVALVDHVFADTSHFPTSNVSNSLSTLLARFR